MTANLHHNFHRMAMPRLVQQRTFRPAQPMLLLQVLRLVLVHSLPLVGATEALLAAIEEMEPVAVEVLVVVSKVDTGDPETDLAQHQVSLMI